MKSIKAHKEIVKILESAGIVETFGDGDGRIINHIGDKIKDLYDLHRQLYSQLYEMAEYFQIERVKGKTHYRKKTNENIPL